jgi:hypothetical protein
MRKQSRVLKRNGKHCEQRKPSCRPSGKPPKPRLEKLLRRRQKLQLASLARKITGEAAKSYRDEGRDDLAKLAENKAGEIEVEDRKEQEEKVKGELKSAWDKNLYEEVEANPDLKDSSTPLYKAVSEMLQNHAILRNYPAGIKDAVGIAKIRLKAEAASDLEKKVAKYESELAQLRKATTPASGQPSAPAKQKQFHELSSNEQEKELLRMAMEADRMGV